MECSLQLPCVCPEYDRRILTLSMTDAFFSDWRQFRVAFLQPLTGKNPGVPSSARRWAANLKSEARALVETRATSRAWPPSLARGTAETCVRYLGIRALGRCASFL